MTLLGLWGFLEKEIEKYIIFYLQVTITPPPPKKDAQNIYLLKYTYACKQ